MKNRIKRSEMDLHAIGGTTIIGDVAMCGKRVAVRRSFLYVYIQECMYAFVNIYISHQINQRLAANCRQACRQADKLISIYFEFLLSFFVLLCFVFFFFFMIHFRSSYLCCVSVYFLLFQQSCLFSLSSL